jgi:hypothetical protein
MSRKPKKIPMKKKQRLTRANVPAGYDSWFEYDLKDVLKKCEYHGNKIAYVTEKTYEPDFTYFEEGRITYIESKGRFRTRDEASKYVAVAKALTRFQRIVFIFAKPDLPMPGARVRQDGSRQSHGEWAKLNGFEYYTVDTVPEEWRQ